MFKKQMKKLLALLLCLALLLLFSCGSSPLSEDKETATYRGITYRSMPYVGGRTDWFPYVSRGDLDPIGSISVFPINPSCGDTVFATREETPIFVLYCTYSSWSQLDPHSPGRVYLREGISLSSVKETVFASVEITGENMEECPIRNIPENCTFSDLVDPRGEPLSDLPPSERSYPYGILCGYPDIPYLKCRFSVALYRGELYIEWQPTATEAWYYPINPELLR